MFERCTLWTLTCTLAAACTPTSPATPTVVEAPAEPAPPAPAVISEANIDSTVEVLVDATPVTCGWGSTGVVSTDAPTPYWVIGMVDVSVKATFDEVKLRRIQLFDAQGRLLGEGHRELELRVATPEHDERDFSRQQTTPFEGPLRAGETRRLWFRVRMDDAFESVTAIPVRYALSLRVEQSADAVISGPVGSQWPTA